ncbi:MAG: insulinase family protein [Cytophagales bacterium]|nr:insulinase family protein [Cytophagales bacterium]
MNQKKITTLLLALVLAVPAVLAQTLTDKLPIAPEIKKGTLANGLTYYIRVNSKPEQKVELRLAVKAGSILEDDDQRGLAHFSEHMAFNGSKNFKKNELVSFLQLMGVKFGADLNAYTGFDETVYILPIPVDKPENLEKGFLVLEDWASTVAFDPTEIEKERGVVLEEERLGKGADERMFKKTLPLILEGSKYAVRLPIGTTEVIKTFKPEVIRRFYKDWYRPDLMAVVVVGDVDAAKVEALIKKHFDKLKTKTPARPREYAAVPSRTTSQGFVVTDPEATNHILQIFYPTQKMPLQITVGDYRQQIVKSLSGQMLNLRMQELTQKANPPFIFGGGSRSEFVHGYESYFGFALIGQAGVVAAIEAIVVENERARKFGFSAAELDRAKKSAMRNIERAYNERDKTESSNYAEEFLRNFLSDEPIPGVANEYNYYKTFLDGITLQEINTFTAKNIPSSTEKKLVVFQGPDKADFEIPGNEALLAAVTNAEKIPVTPYEEKAVASSLMKAAPAPARIVSEKQLADIGVTQLNFENGTTVFLKSTDFKNDQIVFSGFRSGGVSTYGDADQYNAQYAATLVGQMGVADFTPTDVRKVLAGKTASSSPRLTNLSDGINGQSGSADAESMLQLAHLYFTTPRKDPELFQSFISKQQGMLQNMLSDPRTIFQDSVQGLLYANHVRGPRFPRPKDFEKVSLDRVAAIYKERFGNARGWNFFVVGSFDMPSMKNLVASYIGTLPSGPATPSPFRDLGIRPVKGVVQKEIQKGKEPKSFISIAFTGETPFDGNEQLKLQALLDLMNIKLIETLREELSGIYGGGMNGSLSKNPYNSYTINVSLPCGPENVDRLIKATFDEIQKVKDNGPSAADLTKVKEAFSKKYMEDMKDNNYWLSSLQRSSEMGTNPATILTTEKRMNALTSKDLQEAARKYFNMKNYFQAVLNPEK